MARKNQGVFAQTLEDEFKERKGRLGHKKRGRKNKFHAQIDDEDKNEQDHLDASDQEQLQIIKEQELEEEDNLRKNVKKESKQHKEESQARKKALKDEQLAKKEKDLTDAETRKKQASLASAPPDDEEDGAAKHANLMQ